MTSEQALALQQFYIHMHKWRDSERLRRRWREVSDAHFGGKLPPVRIGYNTAMVWKRELDAAAGWVVQKGRFGGRQLWVCLHPRMKRHAGTPRELCTVVHEAIHVLLISRGPHAGHGGDFRHEFERLLHVFDFDYARRAYHRYGWPRTAKFSVFENKWLLRTYSSPPTTTSATTTS